MWPKFWLLAQAPRLQQLHILQEQRPSNASEGLPGNALLDGMDDGNGSEGQHSKTSGGDGTGGCVMWWCTLLSMLSLSKAGKSPTLPDCPLVSDVSSCLHWLIVVSCPRSLCACIRVCIGEAPQLQPCLLGCTRVQGICLHFPTSATCPARDSICAWKSGSPPVCPDSSFSAASIAWASCWNLPLAVMARSFGTVTSGMLSDLSPFCCTFLAGQCKPQNLCRELLASLSGLSLKPGMNEFF